MHFFMRLYNILKLLRLSLWLIRFIFLYERRARHNIFPILVNQHLQQKN